MLRYHYSDDNEFGLRLRQARKAAGLTLQACADRLNSRYGMCINKGSISKYENGIHEPSISLVHCLSEILDVDRDYLLGRSDNQLSDDYSTDQVHFKIEDDSMAPRYLPEDILLINTSIRPQNGMYCLIVCNDGNKLVRRLIHNQKGWVLAALNPNYENMIIGYRPLSEFISKRNNYEKSTDSDFADITDNGLMIEGVVTEVRRRELFSEQH